jgi:hypothetical protein
MKRLRGIVTLPAVLLIILAGNGYGMDWIIGGGVGYTAALKNVRIATFPEYDRTAAPRSCLDLSVGVMTKGHYSFTLDMLYQKYDAADRQGGDVIQTWKYYGSFVALGAGGEYRLFKDHGRSWNPFLSAVLYGVYLSGADGYPGDLHLSLALGTRFPFAGNVYFTPKIVYDSGVAGLSFRACLDLVL